MVSIRLAQQKDLERILEIQAVGYDSSYHEPKETFEAMIRAYPVGCIVAEDSLNKIHCYLFMHTYLQNKIQELTCDDVNKKLKLPKLYVYHLAKIQQFYLEGL